MLFDHRSSNVEHLMTILEPNKHEHANRLLWGTTLLLLLVTGWSIAVYNETVLLHHKLRAEEEEYKAAITKNAELKNERYAQTDGGKLRDFAEARGLVKVRNPGHINVGKGLFVAAR